MIKNLSSSSPWLQVQSPYTPSFYNYNAGQPNSQFIGSVRWNPNTSQLEAWDGNIWVGISGPAQIEPSSQMQEVLEWAMERMLMDRRIQNLIETNPTVADAHATYVKAAEQLAIVANLVQT